MPSLSTWLLVLVALYFVRRLVQAVIAIRTMKGIPVRLVFFSPVTIMGSIFPVYTRWYPRLLGAWIERNTRYNDSEAVLFVPVIYGDTMLSLGSPEVIKTMLADPFHWPKPDFAVTLNEMGENVVTSRGDEWRFHRRAVTPAFSNETHVDVWEVTRGLYYQMLDSAEWRAGDHLFFPSTVKYTTRLALLVIAACGFNMRLQWNEEGSSDGLDSPIDNTVVTVSGTIVERLNFGWIFKLPFEGLRKIDRAWHDLHFWLKREVRTRKAEAMNVMKHSGRLDIDGNVFGRLINASIENENEFDDDKVVGNLFIFFFAGHETTAYTLVNALALLALDQDEQERLHSHILSVIGDREPAPSDFNDLAPILWVFYEALRFYPTAHLMLRQPIEDTIISHPNLVSTGEDVVIPKGTIIWIDLVGASRNPRIFSSPETFNPSRWSTASEASKAVWDNFFGFSAGPRVCIGKRFASFEAVCWLTLLLRDWKVEVKLNPGETPAEWKERVMQPEMLATMRMKEHVPLQFTRRVTKA